MADEVKKSYLVQKPEFPNTGYLRGGTLYIADSVVELDSKTAGELKKEGIVGEALGGEREPEPPKEDAKLLVTEPPKTEVPKAPDKPK